MDIKPVDTNFSRIDNLLRNVAQPDVKVTFDKDFSPVILQQTLNRQRAKVLEPLRKKKVISREQWSLLFPYPNKGKACSTTFDLNLMTCLLRNLTPIPVGDGLPCHADKSEGADLSRLKYYRNMIAHCPSKDAKLTNEKFEIYWNDISQAIVRLGGAHFQTKCLSLKVGGANDSAPIGLKRLHVKELIEKWKKEKNYVIETIAIKRILDLIENNTSVMAVGSSGCGKSTSIHYVALSLYQNQGYEVIHVYSPEEIRQYYNPE